MNDLTKRLFAEGFTREHHPDYVTWSNWNDFEYTAAALREMIWEAPCGLIKQGCGYNNCSQNGVTHCPENDNPLFGCPYFDEVPCEYRLDTKLMGANCAFHQIVRHYDYSVSVEKLWGRWDKIQSQAWQKQVAEFGYCSCMEWDRKSRKYVPRYDVEKCIQFGCQNEVCAITRKERNLQRVNIYYDILRLWRRTKGGSVTEEKKLEKGVRRFKKGIARTDAEIWLKVYGEKEFRPKMTFADRRDRFFSDVHGKEGFGEYEAFEFTMAVRNVRIECREHRDLLQDLADIAEGYEVVHTSDLEKQAQMEKRQRKEKRQLAKLRRQEKLHQQEKGKEDVL